jgi:hypothetical protein
MRKTYHFLIEPRIDGKPGFETLFRIEAKDEACLHEVREMLVRRVSQFDHITDGKQITEGYHGEAEDYGEDGWELTKQLFEIGSEISIGLLSDSFRKGKKLQSGKLVHCFLLQQGVDEEAFHASALVGRVMVHLRNHSVSPEVEKRTRYLLEQALDKARSSRLVPM